MVTGLLRRVRRFGQTRVALRCPRCGEAFYGVGFDVTHESTLDGVACGGVGTEIFA